MDPQGNLDIGEKIIVRRGRVDSVDLYEVKENELELLEKGSPSSLQLNFSIFLFSIAFSAILTLTTTTAKWSIMTTVFVVVAVIGILLGSYLLITWLQTRTSISGTIATIRNRIPPEPIYIEDEETTESVDSADDQAPAG